ncbi:MAG: hypothetical protein AAB296_08965 [Candidatus Desantisbacteria bacterium]
MAVSLMKEEEQHIIKILPFLLKKDRQFRTELYSVLMETFATKEDFVRILEEIRISREEANKRFEAIDNRFEVINREMAELRLEIDKRFEATNQRLEIISIALDNRFKETYDRFEAMQQQMDERFEAVQKQMDKRFEAMQQQMDERFQAQNDWIGVVVGGFQRRAGRSLEDAIAGTLRVALKRPDVKPENLKMRQKITDDNGLIGPKGRSYEIDLWIHNSESMVFEVKSYAEIEDAVRFNDKAELTIQKLGLSHPSKIFITLGKDREMTNVCNELGIELV